MRPMRDADFPEVLAVAHAGIHDPGLDAVLLPVDRRDGRPTSSGRSCSTTGGRGPSCSAAKWALDLGVWHEGRFVGVQGVSTEDFLVTRTGETGSWLGQQFHGRGIGTLMRQAMCVLCLDHLGFEEVMSAAFSDNPASLAVSRKVGYRRNGEQRLARKGVVASNVKLVLTPDDLVRPPYDVEVVGAETFRELVGLDQGRAT